MTYPFRFRAVFLFLFFLLLFNNATLWAEKVRYVVDGDTFVLEDGQHIRMIGIDAPEIDHPKHAKKGEPFGEEAKRQLAAMVEEREITLKDGTEKFDKYGRRLAYVFLSDGTFVNREMIRLGWAETFRKFKFQYKEEFMQLEAEARKHNLGMWNDGF